jgi:hypothetical protein
MTTALEIPHNQLAPGMIVYAEVRGPLEHLARADIGEEDLTAIEEADTEAVIVSLNGTLFLVSTHLKFDKCPMDEEPEVEPMYEVIQVRLAKSIPVYKTQEDALLAGLSRGIDDLTRATKAMRQIHSKVRQSR